MSKKNKIGFGTAAIGRPLYINIRQNSAVPFSLPEFRERGYCVLEEAYNKGIRFFDTSPGYGMAEQLLLDWLAGKEEPSIEISTKWGYTYVANFDPNAKVHEVKEHSIKKLKEQWEFSKQLLPYLKVYQIHSATFETGVLANVEVLEYLHRLKKEHHLVIGLTTTGANQVEVIEKALDIKFEGELLFGSIQSTFNVLDQSVLVLKDKIEQSNIELIVKEALGNGRVMPNDSFEKYQKLYAYLIKLANKYAVGVDAVAIKYCMECFPEATILSGADNGIHIDSNLKANCFLLNEEELLQLKGFGIETQEYWKERGQLNWN